MDLYDMTGRLKRDSKVIMMFQGQSCYHFLSPDTDCQWQRKSLIFHRNSGLDSYRRRWGSGTDDDEGDGADDTDVDEDDSVFPLIWTRICQVSRTEWMMFMGQDRMTLGESGQRNIASN